MPRAAIYARFSSERQSERSIDDQVRLCREYAKAHGFDVVEVYPEFAISGAFAGNRPQLQSMLADAGSRRFDVILAEALDRLSRGQKDTADICERMRCAGVRILTLGEGEISELHVGLKGTMNALFLKDLAAKTSRGMRGNAEAGQHTGGRVYGYRTRRELNADGSVAKVWLEIFEEEAAVVRRIFREFALGKSARAIANGLNAEGVPSPRGGRWCTNAVSGSRQRATGIIYNPIYIGKKAYRKLEYLKDPSSGRRVARLRPEAEWLWYDRPELRIVDQATYDRVRAGFGAAHGGTRGPYRRGARLFGGLTFCGCCGAGWGPLGHTRHGKTKLGCYTRAKLGAEGCSNTKTVTADLMERRILAGLREKLLAPDIVEAACRAYQEERRRLAATAGQRNADLQKKLGEVERGIAGMVRAIEGGAFSEAIRDRINALEADKRRLQAELAAVERPGVVRLHPGAADRYREIVGRFEAMIVERRVEADDEARAILRGLVEKITIHPRVGAGAYDIQMVGSLAALFDTLAGGPLQQHTRGYAVGVVAGGRFEQISLPQAFVFTVWI
jgi:site-specific DNA recombinase